MASFADLRPIIVIACFLSLFLFLVTQMAAAPPPSWGNETYASRINPNENFSAWNALYWNMTNGTLLEPTDQWTHTAKFRDVNMKIYVYNQSSGVPLASPIIQIDTFNIGGWGITWEQGFEHFNWYRQNDTFRLNEIGTDADIAYVGSVHGISISQLITDAGSMSGNQNLTNLCYTISNERITEPVQFIYNTSAFYSPISAFVAGNLFISFGEDYSEQESGLNVLSLISGLLFWSLPGVPTEIYAIIAFVVWPPIIYVAAIWILRIVGSVFGGGGGG